MTNELLADAYDDVGFFSADPFALDSTIAELCDVAAVWLCQVAVCARAFARTTPEGIAALMPRVYTGYMPEPVRRNVRHRLYRDGLRTPKDQTARDMAQMELWR